MASPSRSTRTLWGKVHFQRISIEALFQMKENLEPLIELAARLPHIKVVAVTLRPKKQITDLSLVLPNALNDRYLVAMASGIEANDRRIRRVNWTKASNTLPRR